MRSPHALIILLLLGLGATAVAAPRVAIVQSGDIAPYAAPARRFKEELLAALPNAEIEEHVIGGDRTRAQALVRGLAERDVALIVAIGARAAVVAAREARGTPVLFTSVLNWRAYRRALGQAHVAGVALEVPADAQLTQIKFLSPDLRRVVVVTRGPGGDARLAELQDAGRRLRLEIVPMPLADLDELSRYANRDRVVTAVYPLADPAIYTGERFLRLVALTRAARLPLIAYSDKFVEAGAVMAVSVSYGDLGAQLALQAEQVLTGSAAPAALGVAPPVGTTLAINQAAAGAIGLRLPEPLVRITDRVFTRVSELAPPPPGSPERLIEDERAATGDADPFAYLEERFFAVEEEIVRVAARRSQRLSEAPSIVSVLTHDDLVALGVTTLADALQLLPGVTARYTRLGRWEVLFRGVNEPADLLVLIDGQRVNSMYDGAALFDLPVDELDRIEVIRGPGSALYGTNALTGVISVQTFGGARRRAAARFDVLPGDDRSNVGGALHARVGTDWGRWSLDVAFTGVMTQGGRMRMPLDVNGPLPPGSHLDDHKRQSDLFLRVVGRLGRARLVFDPKLLFHEKGPNFGPTETLATDSSLVRQLVIVPLEVSLPVAHHVTLRGRAAFERQDIRDDVQIRPDGFHDRANPIPAADGLRHRTLYAVNEVSIEPQAVIDLPPALVLTLGVLGEHGFISGFSYDQNYLDQDGTLQSYENFSPTRQAELAELGVPTSGFQNYNQFALAQRDADRWVASGYAQGELKLPRLPVGDVWLTAGLRVDRFSDYRQHGGRKTYTAVNPRAALVWSPLRALGLKLIYGRAFRAPTFQELYDATTKVSEQFFQIPNEELRPETTNVLEAGLEVRPAGGVVVRGNAFLMITDGNLGYDPTFNPAGVQVINFPGREVRGLELELSLRPTPHDFLTASFSDLDAEQRGNCVRPEPDGSCTGDANVISSEITDIPRQRVSLAASARPVGLALELAGRARGRLYRALGRVQLAVVVQHVGASRSNARVTFEELNFPFRHPGYDRVDVGLTVPFHWLGGAMSLQLFAHNVLDADVAEPLVLTLEPRPAEGYFLPRPGRTFMTRLEARF